MLAIVVLLLIIISFCAKKTKKKKARLTKQSAGKKMSKILKPVERKNFYSGENWRFRHENKKPKSINEIK